MQYLYPVAQLDQENILVMYQTSVDDLGLWIWNCKDNSALKELSSLFLPSHVQIMPSKHGYSFIDRGRIRVKLFNKRAPRAIDIYEPIHAITAMKWINDDQFYFTGKYDDHYHTFLCDVADRDVKIFSLHDSGEQADYLYPSKINQFLFCVQRTHEENYTVVKTPWSTHPFQAEQSLRKLRRQGVLHSYKNTNFDIETKPEKLVNLYKKTLCFLSMQHESLGYVLSIETQHKLSSIIEFACHRLTQCNDGSWNLQQLFKFQLPKNILVGSHEERLHESIYPFLPVYTSKWIYFTTYDPLTDQCCIQRYDVSSGSIELVINAQRSMFNFGQHFFAPCIIDNVCYCGVSCKADTRSLSLLSINPISGLGACSMPHIFV